MSRTFANFLLFEDVLGSLPEDSAQIMKQAVSMLLNPSVKIVEEDCGTLLGKIVSTNYEIEGLTSLATDTKISKADITSLLANGIYETKVRDLHNCISNTKGGVCRKCYEATLLGETAPSVGTTESIYSSIIYQSDVIIGNGYAQVFTLSQTEDEWDDVRVIPSGELLTLEDYYIGFDYIEFAEIPAINDSFVIHFIRENTEPFQGYISKTYTGGLLGMEPLPTLPTLLRESIYSDMFSETFIGLMTEELNKLKNIPSTYLGYLDRIHDTLEKVLYILYLYALHKSLEN